MSRHHIRTATALAVSILAIIVVSGVVSDYLLRASVVPRWVNDDPEKLLLGYTSASAPWPGKIVVHGLEIRGSDPNVQWWFRMERAEIRVSLLDLLRRRFHASSVRASGLSFRLRQRLTDRNAAAASIAPLPPIPGFAKVPAKGGPPYFRAPEAPGQYWRVEIDDLLADAGEIWIDQHRYEGEARVAGRFFLWPRKEAQVGPARVDFIGGRVWLGRDVVAEAFRARAEARIAPFDPREIRGEQVYRFISGNASLSGAMPSVAFLNYYLRNSREPRLSDGRGGLAGELHLDKGVGKLGLTIAGKHVKASYRRTTLVGDATLHLALSPWTPAKAEGRVERSSVELSGVSTEGVAAARDWRGKFAVGPGTLKSATGGLELSSRVRTRCRDARPLYTLFGVALPKWAMPIVKLDGLEASAYLRLGPSTVEVRDLNAQGGKFSIAGNYRKRGTEADGAFLVSTGALSVGVEIAGGKSSVKVLGAKTWYAEQAAKSSRK